MKKILIATICLVLLAGIGAFFGYQKYKKSPLYSLKAIGAAFLSQNRSVVEKYIDFDDISEKFVLEALAKDPEISGNPFALGMIQMMKPMYSSAFKESFFAAYNNAISTSNASTDNKNKEKKVNVKSIKSIKTLQNDGELATVEIIVIDNKGENMEILLGMKKVNNHWQVNQVINLMDLLKQIGAELPTQTGI